jgi:hypothetical protein
MFISTSNVGDARIFIGSIASQPAAGLVFFFDEWHRRGRPSLPFIGRLSNGDGFEPLLDEPGFMSEAPDDVEDLLDAALATQDSACSADQPPSYVPPTVPCISPVTLKPLKF